MVTEEERSSHLHWSGQIHYCCPDPSPLSIEQKKKNEEGGICPTNGIWHCSWHALPPSSMILYFFTHKNLLHTRFILHRKDLIASQITFCSSCLILPVPCCEISTTTYAALLRCSHTITNIGLPALPPCLWPRPLEALLPSINQAWNRAYLPTESLSLHACKPFCFSFRFRGERVYLPPLLLLLLLSSSFKPVP